MTTTWKIKILLVFGALNALCEAELIEASDRKDRWIEDAYVEIKEYTDDGFAANSNEIVPNEAQRALDRGEVDYCGLYGSDHTMCLPKVGDPCKGMELFESHEFEEKDKQKIVDLHNEKRREVALGKYLAKYKQPGAANMRKLSWDDDLAMVAQRWANQCTFAHDHPDHRRVPEFAEFPYVGQNIRIAYSTKSFKKKGKIPVEKSVKAWFNEIKDFPAANISPFQFIEKPVIGHYTQLAWAETYKIGCGASFYKQGPKWYKKLVVCNYGPMGNTNGRSMYKEGKACADCPSTCDDGLCV